MSHMSQEVFNQAQQLLSKGESFVIVTMLASAGHTPQDPGAKILVTHKGLLAGTIGGGKVEAKAIDMAVDALISKQEQVQPWIEHWNLQKDVGMSCGGSADILFECFQTKPWSIVVFGAGHVAQALVRMLVQLDCRVTCLDPRPEWINKLPPAPQLDARCEADMARFAADVPAQSYCVVVTKGHDSDLPILRQLLPRQDLPYIGVIGSKVKARILRADLLREGFAKDLLQSLHCPIGLPFGSNHPAEIAISIIAQLLEVRDKVPTKQKELLANNNLI
ncbi:MAG: xanthine dehydrogenase accessory protein XdhC [Oligoflexus sp.]